MDLGFQMWDGDNHLYEAIDAFTRHLPAERQRSCYWSTNDRGHRHLVIDGRVWDFIPNPTFDPVAVPGALDRRRVEPLADHPEYQDRDARLRRFDEQGIEASLMFPTLASGLEEVVGENISLHTDLLWSYNRWLAEEWGFDYRGRIFGTPLFSLSEPDEATRMLDWALGQGTRAIMLASGSVLTSEGRRSPGDPMFDGFWARCAEAGTLVCAHISANGYNRYSGDYTGHYMFRPFEDHTVDRILNDGRAIADFFTVMVWHGALTRHRGLRLMSVENGSQWVGPLLTRFRRFARPGLLDEDPIETFQRAVLVTPHWEDPIEELVAAISAETVVAGSDWPHYDALSNPTDFAKYLAGLPAEDIRRIMRDNLRSALAA
jgi:predicted TIM-barrel fold metal-dependent hydrolase